MLRILSLGAGVQSTTVLLMSKTGELPAIDHVIFADTQWEPAAVYKHLEWLRNETRHLTKWHLVSKGSLRDSIANKSQDGKFTLPYRTISTNGEQGLTRRYCTRKYKIEPIEQRIRAILGLKHRQRYPKEPAVEHIFGISFEEWSRMREPPKWAKHSYPLVDMKMTRQSCLKWMRDHGYPEPPRSACVGCPFRTAHEWASLTDDEWKDAIEIDEEIRTQQGFDGKAYLHRSLKPLATIDRHEDASMPLFDSVHEDCEGFCGV